MTPNWTIARQLVPLDPTVTMLNTGSFGPTPTPVLAYAAKVREELAAGPTNYYMRTLPPLLWQAREATAAFLGTTPERLVFTSNVSVAINFVAHGLRLNAPGEILMTDHEYGAMVWCWQRAGQRHRLNVKTFALPRDPDEIVEAATRAMTPKTRVLFFSHVLSPTGLVMPAKAICEAARRRGILTVVDGAHAPAMIPLSVSDIGADFYTGNLHKWLLAPMGAGFLAVGPGMEDRLAPMHVSWGYYPDLPAIPPDARDIYGSTPRTRFLEFDGTRDPAPWLSVPEAIRFQTEIGFDAIRARHAELAAYCHAKIPLPPATPKDRRFAGSLTAFELPSGLSPVKLRERLWAERIEIPVIERPDRSLLRVSHHFYTTEAEIDRLAAVLPAIVASD